MRDYDETAAAERRAAIQDDARPIAERRAAFREHNREQMPEEVRIATALEKAESAHVLELAPRVLEAVREIAGGEVSIGETLRRTFPEAESGDVSPDGAARLDAALMAFVAAWARDNVPAPEYVADGHLVIDTRAELVVDELEDAGAASIRAHELNAHDCAAYTSGHGGCSVCGVTGR